MKAENSNTYLDRLITTIEQGLKEGIRREVESRRRQGLPLVVSNSGKVEIVQPTGKKRD